MDLLMSCFITPTRALIQSGNIRGERIDVFKWTLKTYATLPFNKVNLFIELDDVYASRRDEIKDYAYELFGDRLTFTPKRLLHKHEWKPVIEKMAQYADDNYPVWFAQSDDHIFVDFNLDILNEGLEYIKNDPSPYRSLLYTHWPEVIRISGLKGNCERVGTYIRSTRPLLENHQLYNFGTLKHVFTDYEWSVDPPTYGWIDCLKCNFDLKLYVPLRELCRHFDGYSHVKMRIDKDAEFPALTLPPESNNFNYTKEHLSWRFRVPHWGLDPMIPFTIPDEWEERMLELYTKSRKCCVFCKSVDLSTVLDNDIIIPEGISMSDTPDGKAFHVPYNIQRCANCNTYQNKYLGDLNTIYNNSHIYPIGNIRNDMNLKFSNIICSNENIKGIVEIGGGDGKLSDMINCEYYIVDPGYHGTSDNKTIIRDYVENVDTGVIPVNTVVMSHVFEHFYNPRDILEKILTTNIEYVYITHPDFDSYTENEPYTYNILQIEHTFYVDNDFITKLLSHYGFELVSKTDHSGYCVFFEFARKRDTIALPLINVKTDTNFKNYFSSIKKRVDELNELIDKSQVPVYIFPCSVHSVILFKHGLNYKKLAGAVDNSSYKIGKFMYGYNVECFPMSGVSGTIIMNGGCFNKDIVKNSNLQYPISQ